MKKKYTAYFFDFDGVIADSVEIKTRAFETIFAEYGSGIVRRVADHHRKNGGMPRREKFEHYLQQFLDVKPGRKQLDHLCAVFSRIVVEKVIAAPEIPGAEQYIRSVSKKAPCFIISGTPDEELKLIVKGRGLEPFFEEVMGSGKKKYQHLCEKMEKYNFKPAKCVFFGDASSDLRAAGAAGVDFIGILSGPDAPLLRDNPGIRWYRDFTEAN